MECYIDNRRQPEKHFWNSLQGIATERQVQNLLDGREIEIGGVKYSIDLEAVENNE